MRNTAVGITVEFSSFKFLSIQLLFDKKQKQKKTVKIFRIDSSKVDYRMWLHIWLVYGIEWTVFILFMYLLQLCYIYVYILVDGDLLNSALLI